LTDSEVGAEFLQRAVTRWEGIVTAIRVFFLAVGVGSILAVTFLLLSSVLTASS
jgi:hypothetical protein